MKNLVLQITGYVLLLGLLFFGVRVWDNIDKWNVNESPEIIAAGDISNNLPINRFTQIKGGTLDIANAYEQSLTTRKSQSKIISKFYIPVVASEKEAIYILKRSLVPTIADLVAEVNASGLLLDQSELPEEMLRAFNNKYEFKTKIYVLDETFKPQNRLERAKGLLYPLYTIIGMLLIRFFLTRKPKTSAIDDEKISDTKQN